MIRNKGGTFLAFCAFLALISGSLSEIDCNFENGFCGYTQGSTDNSDWQIQSGPTSTSNTGPSFDHTTGKGKYAYFESSLGSKGFSAQLISPAISVAAKTTKCLVFWYHMYGQHVYQFNLNTQPAGGGKAAPIWTRTGDQGNNWTEARIELKPKSNFKLIFEAVRGSGYKGDIGLDDISVRNGACPPEGTVIPSVAPGQTKKPPVALACDFETDDICSYSQSTKDDFDWRRSKGTTGSVQTGPTNDHTYGTPAGHYMFIEASDAKPTQKAQLITPTFPGKITRCLRFWYNMYGRDVDTLNVYAKYGKALGNALWTLTGDQGQGWQIAEVTIKRGRNFNLVFEAVRGNDFKGDIAIDDVKLSRGACPAPGSCNFERNLCAWSNTIVNDDFDWVRKKGATTSKNTGPGNDHTRGGAGYYLYIEASKPRRKGDRARFVSQTFRPSTRQQCFAFWYHMYGAQLGTLNVYVASGSQETLIWQLFGDRGNKWQYGRFSIPNPKQNFKVIFEGVVGNSVTGDIALDDLRLLTSSCTVYPKNAAYNPITTTTPKPTTPTRKATLPPGVTTVKPKGPNTVTCNFEIDLCAWKQSTDDDFDWTRHKGSTQTSSTGPSKDHTSGHGFYLYTEVSIVKANESSRIQSKQITPRASTQCLSFWYHMYGPHIGKLNVYVKSSADLGDPVWTKQDSQGNLWKKGQITISQGSKPYSVVIEGTGGNGYKGDIGIDDIALSDGACTGVTLVPPTGSTIKPTVGSVVRGMSCDFEGSKICGYTQDKTEQFDWKRNSRSTGTTGTGPQNDHTYGTNKGHYMYTEASLRKLGDKARIMSPTYKNNQDLCLNFYYHMYGSGMGTLNVYTQTGKTLGRPVFTRTGDQGNQWAVGQATIPKSSAVKGFKIVFEGVRGNNYKADIAVDDVRVILGACNSPGMCDFEKGLCTWKNVPKGDDFDWITGSGNTKSRGTGPSSDHTRGDSKGHYMYIETSNPRHPGDKAWMLSQIFPPNPTTGRCLQFWYVMNGQTVDTLNILLRVSGLPDYTLWTLSGSQGTTWMSAQAPIPTNKHSYQLVFEGIRGKSYTGDIAIDDVIISEYTCGIQPSKAMPPTQTTMVLTTPGPTAAPGAFNCTFDQDLCGWSQDKKDQFDWKRNRGQTGSTGTGPKSDHTSGGGYYVYIETSTPTGNGNKARLVSPPVVPGSHCLTFWYNMYGRHVYYLKVYLQTGVALPAPIWAKKGTQGLQWKKAQINIKDIKNTFNVVFEGIKGTGYLGDISVDDVSMADGECPESTNNKPLQSCDFERNDICGFTQVRGDKFDWTRGSRNTGTRATGPSNDHTYGTKAGHYMYTESSFPRKVGDVAKLSSFQIKPSATTSTCVTFWYHMFGRSIGTLNVYIVKGRNTGKPVWTKQGDQGNQWNLASISIPKSTQPYQIMFEGITGKGFYGDIAVDDFSVTTSCPIEGNCDFEKGLCTWRNDQKYDQFDWRITHGTGKGQSYYDHTTNTANGQYMFIAGSTVNKKKTARLLSEDLAPSKTTCLHFWYFIGQNGGMLRVWVGLKASNNPLPVWEVNGAVSNQWHQGQIKIPPQTASYQVIFEGALGSNIGIDDIVFDTSSSCKNLPSNSHPSVTQKPTTQSTTQKVTTPRPVTQTTFKPTVSVNCNFDHDLCGWSQDKTDQFDWVRHSGKTGTFGTGPSGDHTNGKGYYVYIETSAQAKGSAARLISPHYKVTKGQASCFSFWYNMYGDHVSALSVYRRQNGKNGGAIWVKKGTQGPTWKKAFIDLDGSATDFQLVIEALKGPSIRGDIAVDDTSINPGACSSGKNGDLSCSFETSDNCGYTQVTGTDQFDWTRNSGSTNSRNTGPSSDHTFGTGKGHYMYIESSPPRKRGDKAQFISPATHTGGTYCLRFWYHMSGTQIGSLNVYRKSGNTMGRPIWSRKSNQGNSWNVAEIDVKSPKSYQLVFEGVVGDGYRSDIAIDDLNVTTGSCQNPGECSFDKGLCSWTNIVDGTDDFDWTRSRAGTLTGGTGPSADHTFGNMKGQYLFIESSRPRKVNEKARLLSETFAPTGSSSMCMRFWYHMYGRTVGTLRISYVVNNIYPGFTLWQLSGNKNSKWLSGQLSIKSRTEYRILIEGVVGNGIFGDIALDDITFKFGPCGISPRSAMPPDATTTAETTTASTPVPNFTSLPGTVSCNFENNWCGWTQAKDDNFDWGRQKGPTSSRGTGASKDHTFGGGYYVYIETSNPRKPNDKSRIMSPTITPKGVQCVTFWYHMYGRSVNRLNMYAQAGSNLGTPVWTKKGTQGNKWIQAKVDMTYTKQYKIVFEGVRGNSYNGDICLDDISIIDGYCDGSTGVTVLPTGSTPRYVCDFENPKICNYQQDIQDNFDWKRQSRNTGTTGTGPSSDHTYGTRKGNYMYIETSSPRRNGDVARLYTSQLPVLKTTSCFRFYYHMYGRNIGALNIKIRNNNVLGNVIWTQTGNHGNMWTQGKVTLDSRKITKSFQVVFEGVVGNGIQGDIAIDDVSIVDGACTNAGQCSFENGLCSWTNLQTGDDFDWIVGNGGTTSKYTGPTTDNTFKTTSGHYIFIEASAPRQLGDRAVIESPQFPPTKGRCLNFYYHMNGRNIGTLTVYIVSNSGQNVSLWQLKSDQGNNWLNGKVPIKASSNYKILFQGTRGNGIAGDIALDDVSFTESICGVVPKKADLGHNGTVAFSTQITPTLGPGSQIDCDFDSNLCAWKQDKTDQFDWQRNHGSTKTIGTGPTSDNSGKNGYYMYIETSLPRKYNQKARLITPILPATLVTRCFMFYYYMYGTHVADLNVYVKSGPSLGKPTFNRHGTRGQKWHQAMVDVTVSANFQMVIEATVGKGYRGDIAIDDVTLADGPCTSGNNQGVAPGITCDFEDSKICGYTQGKNDKFDWTRDSAGTTSTGTGPPSDHTYGTSKGHYMYIESSSPRKQNDNALLVTSTHTVGASPECVEFWYHMYGKRTGTLNVYLQQNGANGNAVWTKSGDQGNQWNRAEVQLPGSSNAANIVFEGIVGGSIYSDIAIDDVSVRTGKCGQTGSCDFESNTCSWSNSKVDDFDWVQGKGKTGSSGTGPSTDHTTGNATGTYMFIETSKPRTTGDVAILQSPQFKSTTQNCMHFWYHMNGRTVGSLAVQIQLIGQNGTSIWSQSNNQGNKWLQGQVSVPSQSADYRVLFQAIRGTSYTGDIAIDDIVFDQSTNCQLMPPTAQVQAPTTQQPTTILPGSVPGGFTCDFEKDFCLWTQDKTDKFDWSRKRGRTTSSGTGPVGDHTSKQGYYIYMETSGHTNGDSVRLISPQINGATQFCLRFFYHMYGPTINRLNVYFSNGKTLGKYVWSKYRSQGNAWKSASIQIAGGSVTQGVTNVVFEAVRGRSYSGDIALDDISLTPGSCSATTGTTTSSPIDCSFEQFTNCKYMQDKQDVFDWSVRTLRTSSFGTGPNADHTMGTRAGYYAFIESSSRKPNDNARFITPAFKSTDGKCLTFWYNMNGRQMGKLNIYLQTSSKPAPPIWNKSGNQGPQWKVEYVPLPDFTNGTIIFEGVVGTGYLSDVAIDDVKLQTSCPIPGDCDFESDTCGWTDAVDDNFNWMRINSGITKFGLKPSGDHTLGPKKNGTYMYVGQGSPSGKGNVARLVSPSLSATGSKGKCFNFWYINSGSSFGKIIVSLQQGNMTTPIWILTSDDSAASKNWQNGQVPYQSAVDYSIVIETSRTGGTTGFITLDDVTIRNSKCSITPNYADTGSTLMPFRSTTPGLAITPPTSAPSIYDCNFEKGLCSWTQNKDDDFDWTRKHGATTTSGTGPRTDHTLATDQGYYVFIETSNPRKFGDNAKLASKTISTFSTPKCLSFWYHMYGPHVNTLNVYVKSGNAYGTPVWTKKGTQGFKWKQSSIDIAANASYQIVFEGVRGTSFQGDIALDDISVTDGLCGSLSSCGFEDKTICGYQQDAKDNFNWFQNFGSTGSSFTGPPNDHTYGTRKGKYMYIESSRPRTAGQKARLISTSQYATNGACVTFWYHMYGRTTGSLNIYVRSGDTLGSAVWTMKGQQQNKWLQAQITVKSPSSWEVVFEGVIGNGYQGDIAIDDVLITDGACQLPGDCNFEKDMCSWKNTRAGDDFDWIMGAGSTPSRYTGPTTDHTTKSTNGKITSLNTKLSRSKPWVFVPSKVAANTIDGT
ncbi:hypothetical protein LOTGIDRAFT_152977 [Lottia gigantea]|uniref:MAM domain-containing protein n=1 Tax=Lottia gigantea TaxID=225164 RepID=V4ASQ4_LOTGI|nr:hypothetical protein LOTGIDRAFT_152977 [Lottia gigantea]ESO97870.1 hypothetical protein LOTGIDRAFT_152977 [Lottia gigantea]